MEQNPATDLSLQEWVEKQLQAAPPLTDERWAQIARLLVILKAA